MTQSDAELVYRFADRVKNDAEAEGYSKTVADWRAERPSEYEQLETAHEDGTSQFEWEGIWFETVQPADRVRPHELQSLTGVEPTEEPEIYDLSQDFASDYLNATLAEIQLSQQQTLFSGREFVTLVLSAAEHMPEDRACHQMDISVGNYRGKKGDITDKIQRAAHTLHMADRIDQLLS